jgi:hypothetical protein
VAVISSNAASHFRPSLRFRDFGAGAGRGGGSGGAKTGAGTVATGPVRTEALTATKEGWLSEIDIELGRQREAAQVYFGQFRQITIAVMNPA